MRRFSPRIISNRFLQTLTALFAAGTLNIASGEDADAQTDFANTLNQNDVLLSPANFVLRSVLQVNLTRRFVRMRVHRGSYRGITCWYTGT
jgi:hypothetical protein